MAKKFDQYTREIREDDSGDYYELPETGIPASDLAQGVQDSLNNADTSLQQSSIIDCVRAKKIQLRGTVQTPVVFQDDTAATLTSSSAETYDLTGVGDGGTLLINTDDGGEETVTVNAAAGNSVSGASPSTNISAGVDNKFMISVDDDTAEEVELTLVSCDTGANIATEMQTQIQALGGNKASVTVTYDDVVSGKYAVVSPTLGTSSSVVITAASLNNCTEELKIGTASGGTETAGTGDVTDLSAVTADELATVINADTTGLTADGSSGSVVLTSDSTGRGSSIVMGNGTLNTAVGFTNTQANYGAQGMGYDSDMSDANYFVNAFINGTAGASLAGKCLSVTNKTTSGFYLECETAAAEDYADVSVLGLVA